MDPVCRGHRTEDEADAAAALKMPTLPPSLSPSKKSSSNNSKRSVSSSNENNYPRTTTQKFNHNGERLGAGEKGGG